MPRSSLIAFSRISYMVWKQRHLKVVLSFGNRKSLLVLSSENRVDGAQRMSDVLQITADEERHVSRRIVVVQHRCSVLPQFRTLPAHSIPQTRYNFLVQLFVYHLTTWYKFVKDNAFPVKNHNKNHLEL